MRHRRLFRRRVTAVVGAGVIATALLVPSTAASAAPTVHAWLTTPDLSSRLTQQSDVVFGSTATPTVTFDDTARLQRIEGFGAAFTDTSTYLLSKLSPQARAQVMEDLFSRNAGGAGLNFMRVPMGASDFTATPVNQPGPYSYDEGADDPTLSRFSTAHDDAYVIPMIRQAQAVNPGMQLFANPWSPPGWMKSNGSMIGTTDGQASTLKPTSYGPLAQYFVRFLQDYRAKGVKVWGVTPQNESSFAPGSYPGMKFPAADQARFIGDHLAPALNDAGLGQTKIIGADDIGAFPDYARTLYANTGAATALHGTGWHCYEGLGGMTTIHDERPDKQVYMTECSTGPTGIAGNAARQTLISTNNWASGVNLWNLALDANGGPKMGVGCNGCTGLVTINPSTGTYSYTVNYYELGQFSKFLVPGAQRVKYTDGAGIWAQAYVNPDGTNVIVAHNTNGSPTKFTTAWKAEGSFDFTLPAGATVTFTDSNAGTGPGAGISTIVGQGSGRCLDDTGNAADGVQQVIRDCTAGNVNQRYTHTTTGELRIAGKCLGAEGNNTANGTRVITWSCNGTPSQRWSFASSGTLVNELSGTCLDVTGQGTANGSRVQLWQCTGGTNQQWRQR